MRTLVIGDVHGGLKGLKQALDRASVQNKDTLIFLGDYVDGWSESAETISYLNNLSSNNECIFIRGNHDALCHQYLANNEKSSLWVQQGGQSSIDSYSNVDKNEIESHISFFENLQDFYIDSKNNLFIHAGFQNLRGPTFEHYATAAYWDRTLWELALALDKKLKPDHPFYPTRLKLFEQIYIGHTPVTRIGKTTPYQAANVWNIDTGAAFKGPVTIMDINTQDYWQSDPVWTLYPSEKGRNQP
ncbi:metallophosphoesterase [Planktosalinus lacus]|uniref:Metallophosphatase n=1 Tax=Planktosalinus lacus TaxID=1526573 RepID=A0A8J2V847_9FLAO|nr:metallophosphoesterase [Planktosalinus lacus]GGD81151.1 metallophosphatase [Planktosalinus lacus]